MDRKVSWILKELGLWKTLMVVMILRLPFDSLNAILGANLLERFLRLIQTKGRDELPSAFWTFLLFTVLLFAYNATVWSLISVKANLLLHRKLREKILQSMLNRNGQEMEQYSAGDWITRINADADRTAGYLMEPLNLMHAAIATCNLIVSSVILVMLNVTMLAFTLLVMVPFFILSSIVIIRKVPYYKRNAQEAYAAYTNWMEPVANAGETIRIFDGEDIVLEKIEETSLKIMAENRKAHKLGAWSMFFNVLSGTFGYLLLLLMGNSMMGTGIRDFAQLMKITQYRGQMMLGVMCVNNCINRMKTNLTGAERVYEVLAPGEGEQ